MNSCSKQCGSCPNACSGSHGDLICRCLGVTEDEVIHAITRFEIKTVKEIRLKTGAGDGCNACHKKLSMYLSLYSPAISSMPTVPAIPTSPAMPAALAVA